MWMHRVLVLEHALRQLVSASFLLLSTRFVCIARNHRFFHVTPGPTSQPRRLAILKIFLCDIRITRPLQLL